jgi:hypothetical protein
MVSRLAVPRCSCLVAVSPIRHAHQSLQEDS